MNIDLLKKEKRKKKFPKLPTSVVCVVVDLWFLDSSLWGGRFEEEDPDPSPGGTASRCLTPKSPVTALVFLTSEPFSPTPAVPSLLGSLVRLPHSLLCPPSTAHQDTLPLHLSVGHHLELKVAISREGISCRL